jgi:hypothetical protein
VTTCADGSKRLTVIGASPSKPAEVRYYGYYSTIYSIVTALSQYYYSAVTVLLQCCDSVVRVLLECCRNIL